MIVAKLLGGPHDGRELAVQGDPHSGSGLSPLVIPSAVGLFGNLRTVKLMYYPDPGTLEPCSCCARSEIDWDHGIDKATGALSSITYARHWTVTYRFRGSE